MTNAEQLQQQQQQQQQQQHSNDDDDDDETQTKHLFAITPSTEYIIIEAFFVLNISCKPNNETPTTNPHNRIDKSNYELSSSSMAYYLRQ